MSYPLLISLVKEVPFLKNNEVYPIETGKTFDNLNRHSPSFSYWELIKAKHKEWSYKGTEKGQSRQKNEINSQG
jgi:hypothetical protein